MGLDSYCVRCLSPRPLRVVKEWTTVPQTSHASVTYYGRSGRSRSYDRYTTRWKNVQVDIAICGICGERLRFPAAKTAADYLMQWKELLRAGNYAILFVLALGISIPIYISEWSAATGNLHGWSRLFFSLFLIGFPAVATHFAIGWTVTVRKIESALNIMTILAVLMSFTASVGLALVGYWVGEKVETGTGIVTAGAFGVTSSSILIYRVYQWSESSLKAVASIRKSFIQSTPSVIVSI